MPHGRPSCLASSRDRRFTYLTYTFTQPVDVSGLERIAGRRRLLRTRLTSCQAPNSSHLRDKLSSRANRAWWLETSNRVRASKQGGNATPHASRWVCLLHWLQVSVSPAAISGLGTVAGLGFLYLVPLSAHLGALVSMLAVALPITLCTP